ncbi:MAG: DUF2892 domain-containing protein [Chlamydiae bacterium]|nr:DUF2892 domain-containing protein [Chlamydiota bacterium]
MKLSLPKNIGPKGRLWRFLVALVVIYFAYVEKSWVLLFVSLFIMFESIMSWCVVYHILGINHCPIKKRK